MDDDRQPDEVSLHAAGYGGPCKILDAYYARRLDEPGQETDEQYGEEDPTYETDGGYPFLGEGQLYAFLDDAVDYDALGDRYE